MVAAVRSLVAISATEYSITYTRFGLELLLNNSLCFVFICPDKWTKIRIVAVDWSSEQNLDLKGFWTDRIGSGFPTLTATYENQIVFLMKHKNKSFVCPAFHFYLVRVHSLSKEVFRNITIISSLRCLRNEKPGKIDLSTPTHLPNYYYRRWTSNRGRL